MATISAKNIGGIWYVVTNGNPKTYNELSEREKSYLNDFFRNFKINQK